MGKFSNAKLALIGTGIVIIAAGFISLGPGWSGGGIDRDPPQNPDVDDLGGADEGGAFGEVARQIACNECDGLLEEIERKRLERVNQMMEESGCELRADGAAGGDFSGTMNWQGADFDYDCPNQRSAESLGETIADAKANKSKLDKEIDELQELYEANCPCMVLLHQCVVCAGVPPGGLCPTHFVTSVEECNELGGEFIRNTEAEGMLPDSAN